MPRAQHVAQPAPTSPSAPKKTQQITNGGLGADTVSFPVISQHVRPTSSNTPRRTQQITNDSQGADTVSYPVISQHVRPFKDFYDNGIISAEMLKAIPYPTCSEVQGLTIEPIASGRDVLAQAKTGTGKTLAFLIPTLQRIGRPTKDGSMSILILAPTRELATQIMEEGENLSKSLPFHFDCFTGGKPEGGQQKRLSARMIDVLVATPGRLSWHIDNTPNFVAKLGGIQALIFDEVDRLLDGGFARDINKLLAALPRTGKRQTLMFSATVDKPIQEVARKSLRPDYTFLSTVKGDEQVTHNHVEQSSLTLSYADTLPALLGILRSEVAAPDAKIIVYSAIGAGALVTHATLDGLIPGIPLLKIAGKTNQGQRDRAIEEMKAAKRAVLFSSDVTARGLDIPDVTLIVQVGAPDSTETYIHRLGRTARSGKTGRGLLIVAPFEDYFLEDLAAKNVSLTAISATEALPNGDLEACRTAVTQQLFNVPDKLKATAYRALLGSNQRLLKRLRWSWRELAAEVKGYITESLQWDIVGHGLPPLTTRAVGFMGLGSAVRSLVSEGLLSQPVSRIDENGPSRVGPLRGGAPSRGGRGGGGGAGRGGARAGTQGQLVVVAAANTGGSGQHWKPKARRSTATRGVGTS
ncbi:hypothetical protein FRB96_001020 [Tulasnella sp. 330]|nr:hypothetical protein FRB96_001020 [Tulasnella sp. 330]